MIYYTSLDMIIRGSNRVMQELLLATSIIAGDITIAISPVLVDDQTFESDRSTSMRLVCRDTYFCTKAITEAICKSSAGVPVASCGIHAGHEVIGGRGVLGDDGIGVFGAVVVDVFHSFRDVGHHLDGDDVVEEFGVIVFFHRGFKLVRGGQLFLQVGEGGSVAFEYDLGVDQSLGYFCKDV